MKKNIFLLLGGNILNKGIADKFKDAGYRVFIVDWNDTVPVTCDFHLRIDVKEYDKILNELKAMNELDNVKFAYSSIDLAVFSVAKINKAIGLRVISDEAQKNACSKSNQSLLWGKSNLLNKISVVFTEFDDSICELSNKMKLIVKPDNSASSRGITIIEKSAGKEVLKAAFYKALEEATNKKVVVEEFIEGTEYTVEMIGDSYGNVSVYAVSKKQHTQNTINNKIAVKLHYNMIPEELQKKIACFAINCYKALGFSSSLGHLEILQKSDGTFVPVEIGARSSGYIASTLVDAASGSDFLFDLLKVQNGKRVENGLHAQSENSAVYFFYDMPEGKTVKNVCNLTDFLDSEIISIDSRRDFIKLNLGYKKIFNDNERYGYEILIGPKKILTEKYLHEREAAFLLHLFGED